MALGRWFRRNPRESAARALYLRVVQQARDPAFYTACGVPDSVDGRFEMVALHVFLVLHRLKRERARTAELAQALFDTMFLDMDRSLRELGAGDLGVAPRVKAMAKGLYGRIAAYEAGLAGPDDDLRAALARNVFGTVEAADPAGAAAIAAYMRRATEALQRQPAESLLAGEVGFPPAPGLDSEVT